VTHLLGHKTAYEVHPAQTEFNPRSQGGVSLANAFPCLCLSFPATLGVLASILILMSPGEIELGDPKGGWRSRCN
jgi:hypothetical protein